MNCVCDECNGTGRCHECNGRGEWESSLATAHLTRDTAGYEELIELQKDIRRVAAQAARLSELRPHRARSYEMQLEATVGEIERQADELAKSAAKSQPKRWPFRW